MKKKEFIFYILLIPFFQMDFLWKLFPFKFNIFLQLVSLLIIFFVILRRKIYLDKYLFFIILFQIIIAFSSIVNNTMTFGIIFSLLRVIFLTILIKKDYKISLKIFYIISKIVLYLNTIFIILFYATAKYQDNIQGFIGGKNSFAKFIIPLYIIIILYDYLYVKKSKFLKNLCIVNLIFSTSGTGIIVGFLLLMINFKPLKKLRLSLNKYVLIYIILNFMIIFNKLLLKIKTVNFLIVDILHKTLTFTGRTYIWDSALKTLSQNYNYILGLGRGGFTYTNIYSVILTETHNSMISILWNSGILGVAIFIFILNLVSESLRKNNLYGVSIIIFLYLFSGLTESNIDYFYFWCALSFVYYFKKKSRRILIMKKGKIIFYCGDLESNTGPAIANNMLKKGLVSLNVKTNYTSSNNKFIRVKDAIMHVPKSKYIIICSSSKLNRFVIKYAKIFDKKIFYIMHGYGSYEYKLNNLISEDDKKYLKIKNYEKFILSNVDKIFCVSKTFMKFMKEKEKEFSEKFDYNFNGMEIENFREINSKTIRNNDQIISIGGGMRQKNNLMVCKAIENLNNNYGYNLKFKVIGNAYTDKGAIKKYSFVDYYDEMPHKEVLKMLSESNIYIQNSYLDTFCISVLEGLFCGCSCLFSKYVGVKDVFSDLSDEYIIQNPDNIDELSKKIKKLLNKNNNKDLIENINLDLINYKNTAKNILEKIEKGEKI